MTFVRVDHVALERPLVWVLPDDRHERDDLLHNGIIPLLRGLIGDSNQQALFTQLDAWDGVVEPVPGATGAAHA